MLALDRRIPDNVAELRAGRWNKKEYSKARGLFGRTLGLLGVGSIGREVSRAPRAFGMPVVLWSRRFAATVSAAVRRPCPGDARTSPRCPSPEEVAARSDVLSRPPRADARHEAAWSTRAIFNRLKPGAVFVNTSRGEVVDQAALAEAVRTRGLRAALDVFEQEPAARDRAFARSDRGAARRLRHASHRRLHRSGAGRDRRRNGARSFAPSRRPARCPTSSTSRRRRRRRTCWSCAIAIGPACSRTSSITCAAATSTCRRPRTSCSRAPRPPSRASISTETRPRRC